MIFVNIPHSRWPLLIDCELDYDIQSTKKVKQV